jgi:hypothetical protein
MHESRLSIVIIDCHTDDIDAAARFWAPTGQRFCVVRPQRADFEDKANVWQNQGGA